VRLPADWVSLYLQAEKKRVLLAASALAIGIALADAWIVPDVSLGILYVIPILAASFFLNRRQIVLAALICTVLREIFATGALTGFRALVAGELFTEAVATRDLLIFGTFLVSGFFVSEVSLTRRLIARHLAELREQTDLRRRAEEELGVVVDTSPAAIFIVDGSGKILLANASAHQLLGLEGGPLQGTSISEFLPALATIPKATPDVRPLRSNLECRGRRADGASFLGQVWLSTYYTSHGPRMAAIVLDTSESLRDRESGGLRALMLTSRILMGAVSHSVRNLCAAARVAYANLQRDPGIAAHDDFQALGTLIRGLESIASAELNRAAERQISTVDPNTLLDELRIVIEPGFEEAGIEIRWDVPEKLPTVLGQHYGLLHALLNLAQNSQRALEQRPGARLLSVTARATDRVLQLRLEDNGGGVAAPDRLFQPFQPEAEGTGMGAYVARSVVRAFEGELRYEPVPGGSAFIMELSNAADLETNANRAAN
jgi:two-component system, LuxR family, sensor kinase FixL